MGDFKSINMYEMAMMLPDDGGAGEGRGRGGLITSLTNSIMQCLLWKLDNYSAGQKFPVEPICFLLQPPLLNLLNQLCIIIPYVGDLLQCYCSTCACILKHVSFHKSSNTILCVADPTPKATFFPMGVLFSTTVRLQITSSAIFISWVPHQQPTECGVFWRGITTNSP